MTVKVEKKPPLGIMPKEIHRDKRIDDILEAMNRFEENDKAIPKSWRDELFGLISVAIFDDYSGHKFDENEVDLGKVKRILYDAKYSLRKNNLRDAVIAFQDLKAIRFPFLSRLHEDAIKRDKAAFLINSAFE